MPNSTDMRDPDVFVLRSGLRGVPPGAVLDSSAIAARGWHPADGRMSLPLLSLDLAAFDQSLATMLDVAGRCGGVLAPHVKTPMSPALARRMLRTGAWGVSVADLRQAGVMLGAGLRRIVIANQIGGPGAVRRLADLLRPYGDAETFLFVDSVEFLRALDAAWASDPGLPTLGLLLEIGCGRGGVATEAAYGSLLAAATGLRSRSLRVAGVATYEGTAMRPDATETARNVATLFARVSSALREMRRAVGPETPLLVSAGGSGLFDLVIDALRDDLGRDRALRPMLRCGAAYFSDHGNIGQRLRAVADRGLLGADTSRAIAQAFQPALRLWAEVLTKPAPRVAICGLGLRDVAHDQGLPVPLRAWRDGAVLAGIEGTAHVPKLNDQHAFLEVVQEVDLRIGDVIEFGVRHPCTTIDKHGVIYGLGREGRVEDAFETFFG